MRRNFKKKNNIKYYGVIFAMILALVIGYSLISKTIDINGIAGINDNKWDIHWDNVQPNTDSTVTTETPVISEHATKVTYSVNLSLPGDFYEFDVDAVNEGTIAGTITKIEHNVYKVVGEGEDSTAPDYITYSILYKGTNTAPALHDILGPGDIQTYTVRVGFDKDAEELPDEDFILKVETEVTYSQIDITDMYKITFDKNSQDGVVRPSVKYIKKGDPIGDLPTGTRTGYVFGGWYPTSTPEGGIKITPSTVPTGSVTYYADWRDALPTFGTGQTVNAKFKQLAGDNTATYNSSNTNITSIERSTTEPTAANKTEEHIVSKEGSDPIYAWFDDTTGTIYWWSNGTKEYLNEDASYMFNNLKGITNLDTSFDTVLTTNMANMFSGMTISELDLTDFDTSNVTNMTAMFSGTDTQTLNVSSFDTSKVTNMSTMFASSKISTIDLSSFDTRNVTDMGTMFASSTASTIDLSSFKTPKLTNMSTMFAGSSVTDLDLSNFDVSKVTNFGYAFSSCQSLKSIDISGWNFASVTSTSSMFSGLYNLETINLDNVNTSKITNMGGMFSGSSSIKSLDMSSFDVSKVTTFGLFGGNTGLKSVDISGWSFDSTTSLAGFFAAGLTGLETVNLSNVDTSKITNMSSMFASTGNIKTLSLESFDTTKVTNMDYMFKDMTSVQTITVSDTFTTDKVSSSTEMFKNDENIRGGHNTRYTPDHINIDYAHYDYGHPDPGYFNRGDVNSFTIELDPNKGIISQYIITVYEGNSIGRLPTPTRTGYAFDGWYEVIESGIEITKDYVPERNMKLHAKWIEIGAKFDSGIVTNYKFKQLAGDTIDFQYNPATTADTNILAIKQSETEPTAANKTAEHIVSASDSKLPIYAWFDNGTIYWWTEAAKAYLNEDAQYQFYGMRSVAEIETSFDTGITQNMMYMFSDCYSLDNIDVSTFDTSSATNMRYMFYTGSEMKKLDLSNFDTSNVTDMYGMFLNMYKLEELDLSNWDFTKYNPGQLCDNLSAYSFGGLKKIKFDNAILPQNGYKFLYSNSHVEEVSLRNADTSNMTTMEYMFGNDTSLKSVDLTGIDTSGVTNMSYMFYYNKALEEIDVSMLDTSRVAKMRQMFDNCDELITLDVSNFDTHLVRDFGYFAAHCNKLEEINLSNWNFDGYQQSTSGYLYNLYDSNYELKKIIFDKAVFPADMYYAFGGSSTLEEISLKGVNTSNVRSLYNTFSYLSKVTTLDLSSFDTRNVINMEGAFKNMGSLTTIIVSDDFVVSQVSNSSNMFTDSTEIVGGNGTTYDANYIDKTYAHYDEGTSNPGYFNRADAANYVVNFNANMGSVSPSKIYVKKGTAIGGLPTPTRNGAIFQGWYTGLTDGTQIDATFTPTADTTIYAHWYVTEKYTITFDANEGTADQSERKITRGKAIGDLPNASKEGYIFKGWYTGLTDGVRVNKNYRPSSSMTLYAIYTTTPEPDSFTDDPWDTIIESQKAGTACSKYQVGATKEIDMGKYGKHTVRLANCSTPAVCSQPGFSQTACGMVIEFTDIVSMNNMRPVENNSLYGGWKNSLVRPYINEEIYNALPQELRRGIIDTPVVSGYDYYAGDNANIVTTDKLYLLSMKEVWGIDTYRDTASDKSRQFDYYTQSGINADDERITQPAIKKFNGVTEPWWLRTPDSGYGYRFDSVTKFGSSANTASSVELGVSPAFRIG